MTDKTPTPAEAGREGQNAQAGGRPTGRAARRAGTRPAARRSRIAAGDRSRRHGWPREYHGGQRQPRPSNRRRGDRGSFARARRRLPPCHGTAKGDRRRPQPAHRPDSAHRSSRRGRIVSGGSGGYDSSADPATRPPRRPHRRPRRRPRPRRWRAPVAVTEHRFRVMASDAHVILVDPAPGAADHARRRLEELEQRWSRFLPQSDISRLNTAPEALLVASPDTVALVSAMKEAWRLTNGGYDPTMLAAIIAASYATSIDGSSRTAGRPHDRVAGARSPMCWSNRRLRPSWFPPAWASIPAGSARVWPPTGWSSSCWAAARPGPWSPWWRPGRRRYPAYHGGVVRRGRAPTRRLPNARDPGAQRRRHGHVEHPVTHVDARRAPPSPRPRPSHPDMLGHGPRCGHGGSPSRVAGGGARYRRPAVRASAFSTTSAPTASPASPQPSTESPR